MIDTYTKDGDALVVRFNSECVRVEAWGPDALRVRARPGGKVAEPHVCALLAAAPTRPSIVIDGKHARIRNGRIEARVRLARRFGTDVHLEPVIRYHDTVTGEEFLSEARSHFAGPPARRFKPISSGSFRLKATFAAHGDEHLMGLGQPQHGRENQKGTSTNFVPFAIPMGAAPFELQPDSQPVQLFEVKEVSGWGGRIRTYGTRYQKPLPYHLATPHRAVVTYASRRVRARPAIR